MKKLNQQGFGVVEVVIALVVLLLIGFGGWYVWNKKQASGKTNGSASSAQQTKDAESATQAVSDRAADWAVYANAPGKFHFKYPKNWVFADNPENCTAGLVLFAADKEALGKCASESAGQMLVMSTEGDVRANYKLGKDYSDVTETSVTTNGVNGIKQAGTVSGMEDGMGALPEGTKVVQYVFYTGGRTYLAQYTKQTAYPDAASDFDYLVTKTLTFN